MSRDSGARRRASRRVLTPPSRAPERARSQPRVSRASGLGLGLAVCKTLVEIQSGSIWAEPRDERGTALRFTLPRVHDGNSSPGPPDCPCP
ncbi:MAG: ATP-binding protein [Dehalococcoidia bacterium]